MVNSGHPSNDRVILQSRYSRHKASQKTPTSLEPLTIDDFFRQPHLRSANPPSGSSPPRSTRQKKPRHQIMLNALAHTCLPSMTATTHFLTTPFSHQERPTPKSFPSLLVPLFEACIYTFSSVLCPVVVLF